MEIHEIKQQLTLSKVLQYYNLKPDKNLRLCCPFHDDKTPSMQVYYKTHTAYCFSSNCKTHGKSLDVIDFIMHKENTSKHEAIEKAKSLVTGNLLIVNEREQKLTINNSSLTIPRPQFLSNMFTYFKNAVHNSKPAQEYIQSRGLDATKIEIGYNTAQFHHGARRDMELIQNCVAVGLLTPWGVNNRKPKEHAYRAFGKNGICFAMRNKDNNITGLYFRSTINNEDQKHYYLKDSCGLYPHYPSAEARYLIIAESIIDTATLLQLKIDNGELKDYELLASYGTNRLTDEMKQAIAELPELEEIIFAFDNDQAGNKAVAKYAEELKKLLPNVSISKLELPEGEDVNSVYQGHEPEIFTHLLNNKLILSNGRTVGIENEKPSNSQLPAGSQFNTSNKYKLSYITQTAVYCVQGGVGRVLDSMKITLVIETNNKKSRNKVDLYDDKQLEKLCKDVSEKLNINRDSLDADIYALTDLLDEYRERSMSADDKQETSVQTLTTKERERVESFLKQKKLIYKFNELLGKSGIAGEETNRIFLLIIAISYKMAEPLHALIQGSSGSGKTRLLRQISDCMPQEKVIRLTRVSEKGFYNYPENHLTNKLMSMEDIDGLGEEATFAFRELQSNGELNSATSIKLENGQIVSGEKKVKGPIASLACTTQGEIYEDNMSRVFLIAVDEGMEQTKRIIRYQNLKASGEINEKQEKDTKKFIQQIVRELNPYKVINPFAGKIQLPEEAHKIRRLNDLFQSFVRMITIINQLNRKKDNIGRLVTELEDIETAIDIMFESIVLKVDELDGSLRQFFERLKIYITTRNKQNNCHGDSPFTQREIRQALHLSKAQVNRYLQALVELEYLQQHGFANKGFHYKIMYWDNYEALRKRIKTNMEKQIQALQNH